tara:strand:- start:2800 stop:3087 length:288 start_codon:yes stop_codon:yes gene_type:complete
MLTGASVPIYWVFDPTINTESLYINGTSIERHWQNTPTTSTQYTAIKSSSFDSSNGLLMGIGGSSLIETNQKSTNGEISNVKMRNWALTIDEINA